MEKNLKILMIMTYGKGEEISSECCSKKKGETRGLVQGEGCNGGQK